MNSRNHLLTIRLKKIIGEQFNKVSSYRSAANGDTIVIRVRDDISFDTLQKISEFLGTRKINLSGEHEEVRYSECTVDYIHWVTLNCSGVRFKTLDKKLGA